jgi:acyl-coenzyme A thioesterase PaaI-like protein
LSGAAGRPDEEAADPEAAPPRFVTAVGLEQRYVGDIVVASASISPALCVPGTGIPRIGVLATMADLVVGSPETGPINPTVDLNVQAFDHVPMEKVLMLGRTLKAGRTLFVGEVEFSADGDDAPFARSTATFMNQPMELAPRRPPTREEAARAVGPHVDELLGTRVLDERTLELDPRPALSNGPGTTVNGGVLALFAEVATEHALGGGSLAVTDLDIRFLNRVKAGPVQARADIVAAAFDHVAVRVRLTDTGDGGRIVAHASTLCRPLPGA